MKKSINFLIIFIIFSSIAFSVPPQELHECPHILYKDYTGIHPHIVCCNSTNCLTFQDSMTVNGSGWEIRNCPSNHCYELKSEFTEIDLFSMLLNDASFIFLIIISMVVIGSLTKWIMGKK